MSEQGGTKGWSLNEYGEMVPDGALARHRGLRAEVPPHSVEATYYSPVHASRMGGGAIRIARAEPELLESAHPSPERIDQLVADVEKMLEDESAQTTA